MLQDCLGVIPYVDDILVFGKTKKEHDQNLEKCLHCLDVKNFCLPLSKCNFQKPKVPFLGKILPGTELHINPKTKAAISEAPEPMTGT